MILNSVMRLLISEDTQREFYPFCQQSLATYVRSCEVLYGEQFLSYNVHSLLHLVVDVELLGGLEIFSAFGFENNMPEFRKNIRKPDLKLQQYFKRLHERNEQALALFPDDIIIHPSQSHAQGSLTENIFAENCHQFYKLEVGKLIFSITLRDSCCFHQNSEICLIKNIVEVEETIFLIVQKFRTMTAVYDVGLTLDSVDICHCCDLSVAVEAVNLDQVKNKGYRLPVWSATEGEEERILENEWICISLLTLYHP
ncbi:uncharacterized protein LOC117175244 [Belonocnema kinseyi]|uniref:uncharacterized protein LOC117175244 n=1 Tax=Belonocnema kinseyi TaxID=2817044 RepID=UPI00143D3D4B|nr:uncharacterized protein LOC117175244 [Belonocnema kinseyi]